MGAICRLNQADIRTYNNWKQALITNAYLARVNGKMTLLKGDDLVNYFINPDTRFGQTHIKLSKSQRLAVINQIESELTLEQQNDQELKARFDSIKAQLGTAAGNSQPSAVVTKVSNDVQQVQLTKSTVDNLPKNVSIVHINTGSPQLFPVLSGRLNQYGLNYLYSALKELCIWDEKSGNIVDSNESLTTALLNFRNAQYNTLQHWVGREGLIISEAMTEEEIQDYQSVMKEAWERIKVMLNEKSGPIDAEITDAVWSEVLNPIIAFYALLDFDTLMQHTLSDFITINQKEFGLLNTSDEKFKLKEKKKVNTDFNDSHESSDGDNLEDNILMTFITSTIVQETGRPLSKDFKTTLVVEMKNALENINITPNNMLIGESDSNKVLREFREALVNDSIPMSEKVSRLINVLTTSNALTDKIGLFQCMALGKRLQLFTIAYTVKRNTIPSLQRSSLDRNYSIGNRLIDSLNFGATAFTSLTADGSITTLASFSKKKSKQYVRERLGKAIADNASNGLMGQYSDMLYLGNTVSSNITDIYSDNVKEYLTNITGINFYNEEILRRFNSPRGLQVLQSFLGALNYHVQNEPDLYNTLPGINRNEAAQRVVQKLTTDANYIEFSNFIVQENEYVAERMFSLDGSSERPKTTITTLTMQFNRCKSRLQQLYGQKPVGNVILAHPELTQLSQVAFKNKQLVQNSGFLQHITYADEVQLANDQIVRWVKLNKKEILEAQLGGFFLVNAIENDTITFQIEAASDKIKVPIGNFNIKNGFGADLLTYTVDQTLQVAYNLAHAYYDLVETSLVNDWNVIAQELGYDKHFTNVNEVKVWLDESNIAVSRLNPIAVKHPEIRFLKEILYSPKEIDENNTVLTLNNSLVAEINRSKDYNEYKNYNDAAFNSWINALEEQKCNIDNYLKKYANGSNETANRIIANLFGVKDANEIYDIVKSEKGFDLTARNLDGKLKWDNFLRKYHALYRICHEADIELFQKHYWCHDSNKDNLEAEETSRILKSEKRNNALSATWTPLAVGLPYGVGERVRYAEVESLMTPMTTMFGDSDNLTAHDGGIWSTYILRILENNSSMQIDMAKTSKIIALCPNGFGMVQLKCADYTMDNAFIRNSIASRSFSNQTVDAKRAMKKMLGVAVLGDTFYNNFRNQASSGNINLGLHPVIYNFGGRKAILNNYYPYGPEGHVLKADWTYLDNGETVPTSIVGAALDLNVIGNGLEVTTLYDLWKFFGAELSMGYDSDGEVKFNDASQEYVAYLMCEFNPSLKTEMIGKLVDISASKSTQGLPNSREAVYGDNDTPLVTQYLESTQYGPQQDHSHETEGSTIPALTQVITAIAFNGQNPELVQLLYELLGELTTKELEDLDLVANAPNKTDFYRKIGKMMYNNLKDNSIISNAQAILAKTIADIGTNSELFAPKSLPLSNNQLFHLATSLMLSKLNRAIRQRFPGVSVIQNPSQGILGIYEDVNGVTYQQTQIIEEALREHNPADGLVRTEDIVNKYLATNPKFADTIINNNNKHLLNIGYNVRIAGSNLSGLNVSPEGVMEISTPLVLWTLVDKIGKGEITQCAIVHNLQRNLATTLISWTEEDGSKNNIWLLPSTRALIKARETVKPFPRSHPIMDWHKANVEALRNPDEAGRIGYYASIDDYKIKKKTYVTNVTYRGGEEILPRIFREKMGLRDSLSTIKQAGPKYFRDLVKTRYDLDSSIPQLQGPSEWAVSTDNCDIIFKINDSVENNGFIETTSLKSRILDANGKEITSLYLPKDVDATVNVRSVSGGKTVVTIGIKIEDAVKQSVYKRILDSIKYNRLYTAASYDGVFDTIPVKRTGLTDLELDIRAQLMYTSFLLTLKTISARIPSQSFQSFLANETVGFTEDDSNNGYMNLYEMYFQGSDYDIDHAYTMMFGVNESGIIEGNVFSDYSSPQSLMESLLLPRPLLNSVISIDPTASVNQTAALDALINEYQTGTRSLHSLISEIQNRAKIELLIYSGGINQAFIEKLNAYNQSSLSELYMKNAVMAGIRKASQDLANLKASQVPMEAKPVKNAINNSVKNFGNEQGIKYMDGDPSHIADFLYQGAIGKEGVGIAANSMKATGSIQQDINNLHRLIEQSRTLNDLSLELRFVIKNDEGQVIRDIHEKITRVPNTPLNREDFLNQTLNGLATVRLGGIRSIEAHPLYAFYEDYAKGLNPVILNDKLKHMIEAYDTLKVLYNQTPTFQDVLYEMMINEQNAADMESIFISLCTDNAKELQLYRIAGVPTMLNLPLTMIALGMEIQDVSDICVKYLVPLLDDMNLSRLFNKTQLDVGKLIDARIKRSKDEDKIAWESVKKIYNAAQELRLISGFFKINQGTSVRYAETYLFLANFDNILQEREVLVTEDGVPSAVTTEKIFEKGLEYRKLVIKAYEDKKAAFNVMDIVFSAPHFFSQLRACYDVFKKANNNIAVSYFASKLGADMKTTNKDAFSLLGDNATTKVILVILNYLLTYALKQLPNITFDKWSTLEYYGNWDPITTNSIEIGVSNYRKAELFISFIEKGVIPYLKRNYQDNFFVQSLLMNSKNGHYELPFARDTKGDMRSKMDINQASLAFQDICGHYAGVKTLDNIPISFGDLMFLYSTIINLNRMNPTSTVIYSALEKGSKLHLDEKINSVYSTMDRMTGIATTDVEQISDPIKQEQARQDISDALTFLNLIQASIRPYVVATINGGQATIDGMSYDLTDSAVPLMTMIPPQMVSQNGVPVGNLTQALNTMIATSSTGAQITDCVVTPNNELRITFNTPTLFGHNSKKTLTINGLTPYNGNIMYEDLMKLQSVVTEHTSSLLYSINQALNEHGDLVSNNSISDYSKMIKLDSDVIDSLSALPGFNEWFNSDLQSIVFLRPDSNMQTHIESIGNLKVIVINPIQFQTMSKEESAYQLLNLYLDSILTKTGTEQVRLIQLLSLYGIESNADNLTQILSTETVQKTLEKNSIIKNWVKQALQDTITEDVKETARTNLSLYNEALLYADLYYEKPATNHKPLIGDIYVLNGVDSYIYLGDVKNKLILQNINDPGDIRLEAKVNNNNNWSCKQTLRLTMNFNALNPKLYEKAEYLEDAKINLSEIHIGDLIKYDRGYITLFNIVYSKDGSGKYIPSYICYDTRKELFALYDANDLTSNGTITAKLRDVINLIDKSVGQQNVELGNSSKVAKARVASKMTYGMKFTTLTSGDILTFSKYQQGFILTTNNLIIPVENLNTIFGYDISKLSPNGLLNLNKTQYTFRAPKGETLNVSSIINQVSKLPQFARDILGIKARIKGKIESRSDLTMLSITPTITVSWDGRVIQFNQFNIKNDAEVYGRIDENINIETNDFIEILPNADNLIYTMMQVIDVLNDGSLLVAKSDLVAGGEPELSIQIVNREDINGAILHKSNKNVNNARIRSKADNFFITNKTDKYYILLDFLAKKFNTTVEIINDPNSSWFAKINDGVVEINMAKYDANSYGTEENYVLQLGLHEFTHLVIADLLANNFEKYMELVRRARMIEGLLTNEVYDTLTKAIEEWLVNIINDYFFMRNEDVIEGDAEFSKFIKTCFADFFQMKDIINEDMPIDKLESNIFKDSAKMTITQLRNRRLADELIEGIKIDCK